MTTYLLDPATSAQSQPHSYTNGETLDVGWTGTATISSPATLTLDTDLITAAGANVARLNLTLTAADTLSLEAALTAGTPSAEDRLIDVRSSGAYVVQVKHETSGAILITTYDGSYHNVWLSSSAHTGSIRVHLGIDRSAGTLDVHVYDDWTTTTAAETANLTSLTLGVASITEVRIGSLTTTNHTVTTGLVRGDDTTTAPLWPSGSALTATISDSIGITDATTETLVESESRTDPIGVTDTLTVSADRTRATADPLGITDATATTAARHRAPGDPVGVTDTLTATAGRHRAQVEPVGITDTLTLTWDRRAVIADTIGTSDATTDALGAGALLADGVDLTDQAATAATRARGVADDVSLVDVLIVAWARHATIADAIGATDATIQSDGTGAVLSDVLEVTDATAVTAQRARHIADTTGITDQVTVRWDRHTVLTDLLGLTDAAASSGAGVDITVTSTGILTTLWSAGAITTRWAATGQPTTRWEGALT